jgi:TIR domain
MEVFISWSGEDSRQLALVLKDWISNVIQIIDCWVASDDIENGEIWATESAQKLETCDIGIICLTKENYQAPWINFEAGALSREVEVWTLLLDLKSTDIKGPLAQFPSAIATNKQDMWKLIKTINENSPVNKIKDSILTNAFNMWWEKYFNSVNAIIPLVATQSKNEQVRSNEDFLEEILFSVRDLLKQKAIKDMEKEIQYVETKKLLNLELERKAESETRGKVEESRKLLKDEIDKLINDEKIDKLK